MTQPVSHTPSERWWEEFANAVRASDVTCAKAMVRDLVRAKPCSESTDRLAVIEECAKVVEGYEWVDDASVQGPNDHQRAVAAAVRRMK